MNSEFWNPLPLVHRITRRTEKLEQFPRISSNTWESLLCFLRTLSLFGLIGIDMLCKAVSSRTLSPLLMVTRACKSNGASKVWAFGSAELSGNRDYMEDRHLAIPCLASHSSKALPQNLGLFAVFDGHGGQITSSYAHQNFAEILASLLADSAFISHLMNDL